MIPPPTIRPLADAEMATLRAALEEADLPTQDLDGGCKRFFAAVGADGVPLGYAGLEVYGSDALLRSVVVPRSRQRNGIGRALVRGTLDAAARDGVRTIYLLTMTAEGFFANLDFRRTERTAVPAPIAKTREFTTLCPATAVAMARTLPVTR
ncbi:MAG: arsenic resistance N-acetyltransferase ArsN2 [Alphaproteobacteria bacterium]